ncbi:MAG: threonine ammonia-lyase [Actinomycetota bacterium]|nr:threonine ammonia-lyase [Actinomycetota bacterium]
MTERLVELEEIEEARKRAEGVVLVTPTMPSQSFSRMCGAEVWLKAENLQRTGSFKIRGAMNALSQLPEQQRRAGVVAASAGNHAQGVALAAQTLGIPATVFMPLTAAIPKVDATRGYGANVELAGEHVGEAVEGATAFADRTGAKLVHPYDDPHIIAGQGTLGLELVEQLPDLGTVVVPLGGGGLISGVAAGIKARRPQAKVVGVEASAVAPYVASRKEGRPVPVEPRPTVADGIAVADPSPLAFAHIEALVDELVTVEDSEATHAVALLLERAKFLVEASGAVSLAAVLSGSLGAHPQPVVVVLSGGNIDLLLLDRVVRQGLEAVGRFAAFRVRVPDVPGQLARVLNTIAEHEGNVLSVEHHREGVGLPFGMVEVWIAMETRGEGNTRTILEALPYEVILPSMAGSSATEATEA